MISYEGLTKMHNLFTVEQTFSFFLELILFYTIVKSITLSPAFYTRSHGILLLSKIQQVDLFLAIL